MNLIEKLGLEKCKQIVDGGPEWAESFNVYLAAYGSGGIPCKGDVLIKDLRAALADHDRTDYVSDIRNHIAPTTKVIER
ncbi:TPA: hypothetical protein ACHKET_000922 [Acinetobacter baumannii]|uniref:hypothetical protein n=1 Tax=Acinetobacter baumannii TaxID=470 RepID=UPI001EF4F9D0|nr:hypothetical protein [Acinetobacter baumannii]MCF4632794.1 hypothetical protein [Acinetobacter baumannii]HCQ9667050.1 hypothetical protein [Acinetobacter baumannii]